MTRAAVVLLVLVAVMAVGCGSGDGRPGVPGASDAPSREITIVGWQGEEGLWEQEILAAFERDNPGIHASYRSVAAVDYDRELDRALRTRSGADVISCFGYDWALDRYRRGQLAPVDEIVDAGTFSEIARAPWASDDGTSQFCVPAIANIVGFYYNADIFEQLGLEVPATHDEFIATLDAVARDGRYLPLALGLADAWVGSALAYENIGPNFWRGESGRRALISRTAAFTDPEFARPFERLAQWAPYLPDAPRRVGRLEAQRMFLDGRAAVAPGGSWEAGAMAGTAFPVGAFAAPLPRADAACFITDHPDLGFGLNAHAADSDSARAFLEWTATPAFASVYANAFPGLFSLQRDPPPVDDDLAATILSWRESCESTPRLTAQILTRGSIDLEMELAMTSIRVLAGEMSASAAARHLQTRYEATR